MIDETELKLELTMDGASILEASGLLPGKPSSVEQHSTYFDTPDQLLAKAGLSLRIRLSNGARVQTVKGVGASAAGLFVRSEWERSVDDNRPILDDTTPIPALLREKVHEIGPIFEVHINRQIWVIKEGKTFIEVALDRGEVIAGDRSVPICEIELELKSGGSSSLFAWARRIDAVVPVRLGVLSKAERGYRLRGVIVNSVKAERIALEKYMSVDVAFQRIAGANLRQFRLNEALIEFQNPNALHQARVGLRRLLTAMTIFEPFLANEELPLIRENLRWLTGELGKARNLDVLAARAMGQPLHHQLEAARIDAYSSVAEILMSERARAFMINLAEWIANGHWLSDLQARGEGTQALDQFARDVLGRYRKKLKKAGNIAELNDEQRHRVRKNAKKMRYASEFFAALFDDKDARRRYKRFTSALDRLQDTLGTLNDLAIGPSVLEQIGLGKSLPEQFLLSTHKKADILNAASEAHDDLSDAKRFWR